MSAPVGLKYTLKTIFFSKSGLLGTAILIGMLLLSAAAITSVPYDVVKTWNNPEAWQDNPRHAAPEWVTLFTGGNPPRTMVIGPRDFFKVSFFVELASLKFIRLEGNFNYQYDDFPSEWAIILDTVFHDSRPLATIHLVRPDGERVLIFRSVLESNRTRLDVTNRAVRSNVLEWLRGLGVEEPKFVLPEVALFAARSPAMWDPRRATPLQGKYGIEVELVSTGRDDDANASAILFGKVHGLAGTDANRRDLFVGLVWGAPIALAFGLSAAVLISFIQAILGSLSAWYGGKVDEVVQRATDIYLILPFLPILITISIVYRIDIWTLIFVVVALSLLGGITKASRSITLQVMQEQYIEAAISYGASRLRILFLYILPRLLPYIVANIVLAVPSFIFLEAALSILGLGDPIVPTWGKIISDAQEGGAALHGYWWWVLLPSTLILLTASSFAFIGYALDRVVNPRLRER